MIQRDNELSIRRQCELLRLNRSGLYYNAILPDATAVEFEESLMARIDHWHTRCPYLGSRKIVIKLLEDGFPVCRKTVRRLMLKMGIYAVYPKSNLSKRNFKEAIVPYLLRDYTASYPNQVWSIDITYIPMPHGHMYLTAIIDWYSRRLVGHYLSDTLDATSVIYTVKETVKKCGIPAIINSDQGSQFTSDDYKALLHSLNIRQSMDGRSRWADNIMIERWFRSFKYEEAYLTLYNNIKDARVAIGRYVHTYNFERCHSALDYKTPAECYYPAMLLSYAA